MQFIRSLLTAVAVIVFCFSFACTANTAVAHDVLKKPLAERYGMKSVSCSACHPGSKKQVKNKFGLMFKKAFKGKNYTKRIKAAKEAKDKAETEKIEEEMIVDFKKAIVEIEKTQLTIKDLAEAGLLVGFKMEKDVVAKMGEEQEAAEKADAAK
jgi:hypothetical protein